jgi:hypothetical protein
MPRSIFFTRAKPCRSFGNNWVEVTREAAKDVANVFNSLVARGESRESARRFVLQSVVAMFAEDIGLCCRRICSPACSMNVGRPKIPAPPAMI